MRDPRNPFRMRASEQIASETTFLRLFGAGVLELLPEDCLSNRLLFVRSAPGGGKTSLLRAFTPASLLTLHAHRKVDEYKELYAHMEDLGAVNDSGPQLLGVMLSCAKNYATLDDLPWEKLRKDRMFFGLLNCRTVLASLRGALLLHGLEYPSDLHRLRIVIDADTAARLELRPESFGDAVFDWARKIEASIAGTLDSLDPSPPTGPGHDGLVSLEMLKPGHIRLDGQPVAQHLLVMFDDVHKLAASQRLRLGQSLTGERAGVPIWIAERLEALSAEELLDLGSKHGREYIDSGSTLEHYWRSHPGRFERALQTIADKRVREARSVDIDSFTGCVSDTLETPEIKDVIRSALDTVRDRVQAEFGQEPRFHEWLATRARANGTVYDQALSWRTLEVLIVRERRKQQMSFDFALSLQDLDKKDDAAVRAAAELFLAKEFRLPYYFGFPRIASLASSNIEQFLAVSGDLFEEASAAAVVRKASYQLLHERQDAILRNAAKRWWSGLLRSIPMQAEVRSFVDSIGRCARWETEKPNAPYSPGVTGISITMAERERLRDAELLSSRPDLKRLASVIAICLAHNILEAELDRSQGYERRMILYLNRLLCAHFELPLQYGGWRPKKLDELARWLAEGFRPPATAEERLL